MTTRTTCAMPCAAFEATAEVYDQIYAKHRPYASDVDRMISFVNEHATRPLPHRLKILDWGAGTGEHIRHWKACGWEAVGIDKSPEMVKAARQKSLDVRLGDICETSIGREFLIQSCLFATFSYATLTADQLTAALANVRRHACRGGFFFLDVVNYASCLTSLQESKNTAFKDFNRRMRKSFDPASSLLQCAVEYERGGQRTRETHVLRAYTPQEMIDALYRSGFDVLKVFDPESKQMKPPTSDSYYFAIAARVR